MTKTFIKRIVLATLALFAVLCMGIGAVSVAKADFVVNIADVVPTMVKGAAVRETDFNGIRFFAQISKSDYENITANTGEGKTYSKVEYGMLIVPSDYVTEGFKITVANVFGADAVYEHNVNASQVAQGHKAIIRTTSETCELTEDGQFYRYGGSMTDVIETNLTREFIGTPYIGYMRTGDTEMSYVIGTYADNDVANNTRSMAYVAQVLADKADTKEETKKLLNETYIAPLVEQNIPATYTVKRYFNNGYGSSIENYEYAPYYSNDISYGDLAPLEGIVGESLDFTNDKENVPYPMDAFVLNKELSKINTTVYANNKLEVELYYDLALNGNTIHGFSGIYQGSIKNLSDGDMDSALWTNSTAWQTAFMAIDLGEITTVNDITLYMPHGDWWGDASVEYSIDGKTFTSVGRTIDWYEGIVNPITQSFELDNAVQARFIRVKRDGSHGRWVCINEIMVNQKSQQLIVSGNKLYIDSDSDDGVVPEGVNFALKNANGSYTNIASSEITTNFIAKTGNQTVSFTYDNNGSPITVEKDFEVWYKIKTAADWQLMNTYLDGYFVLANDITLTGGNADVIGATPYNYNREIDWTGVGTEVVGENTNENLTAERFVKKGVAFTGKFDGAGYIVRGFKTSEAGDTTWGAQNYGRVPFAFIGEGGYVGNFTLVDATVRVANHGSFIAGLNLGTIENVVIADDCKLVARYDGAGLAVAFNNGTVRNFVCHSTNIYKIAGNAEVLTTANIIFSSKENSVVENCFTDNGNHLDVFKTYSSINGLGWIYVENFGMFFGNANFKLSLGLSSTTIDINDTFIWYSAQTEPVGFIYMYANGFGNTLTGEQFGQYEGQTPDYILETISYANGVNVVRLNEKGLYMFKAVMTENGVACDMRLRFTDAWTWVGETFPVTFVDSTYVAAE